MTLLCIDPGNIESAFVRMDGRAVVKHGKVPNSDLLCALRHGGEAGDEIVCEMIACYGMPVGAEVFDTCVWIGQFREACKFSGGDWHTITRIEVKKRLCYKTAGVNDGVIRQRLIDLYGGKDVAIGNKKKPGPLYGISGDCWAALAVGTAWGMGDLTTSGGI